VVLHGVRADEQPGADLRVGQAVASEPRHEQFLRSELLVPRPGTTLASGFAGGAQLAPGPFGEARHAGRLEHAVGGAQLLARGTAAAFAAQPLPVQQVRAGKGDAEPGPAERADRLAVQPLGRLALAQQRARAGPDPVRPVGDAGAGHLLKLAVGPGRCLTQAGARGGLDQLRHHPDQRAEVVGVVARVQRRLGGLVVAAEAIAEHRIRPLGERDPVPLAAQGRVFHGGRDQSPRSCFLATERGQAKRAVRGEAGPRRLLDRLYLVGQRRGGAQLAGEQVEEGSRSQGER